jgi:transcriptional regulator with XRE-family HTH domain
MRERILDFMEKQGLSPARFADEIGVQRSNVSHIISGRNNPSYDLIVKILTKYKFLSAEWLLRGIGDMLVSETSNVSTKSAAKLDAVQGNIFEQNLSKNVTPEPKTEPVQVPTIAVNATKDKRIERIILVFDDKTFSILSPEA